MAVEVIDAVYLPFGSGRKAGAVPNSVPVVRSRQLFLASTDSVAAPALAPGDYPFKCEIHPTVMTGTLTVK